MYAQATQLQTMPIISLQTGATVAWVLEPIIDTAKLEILAFRCDATEQKRPLILMARDIRQISPEGVLVDNEEELTNPEDIVRLKVILKSSYNPIGKHVVSDTGRKLGNVDDYTINLETARVQKLHVRQPMFRSWLTPGLLIDRTQIIDITPRQITVRDAAVKAPLMPTGPVPESPA
jgi:sporulation protein YlmC with PRC-barrel domain